MTPRLQKLSDSIKDLNPVERLGEITVEVPAAQYKSIEFIKSLVDGLHHSEQIRNGNDEPSQTDLTITGVHVHHNLAIIEKGRNTEQGAPEWLRGIDHASAYTDA